jgi:hypothetical protein
VDLLQLYLTQFVTINREVTLVCWNGQQSSRRLIGCSIRPQRILRGETNTCYNWIAWHFSTPHWRGNRTGFLQWKLLALQAKGTQQLPHAEDAPNGNCGQKRQHKNLDSTLARRKHGWSTSLVTPGPLRDGSLLAKQAWIAHLIRDFGSRTNTAASAMHMLMLHSQPCTGFNTNEIAICRPRRPCYMLCIRHFKRLVHLQFKCSV